MAGSAFRARDVPGLVHRGVVWVRKATFRVGTGTVATSPTVWTRRMAPSGLAHGARHLQVPCGR